MSFSNKNCGVDPRMACSNVLIRAQSEMHKPTSDPLGAAQARPKRVHAQPYLKSLLDRLQFAKNYIGMPFFVPQIRR